MCIRAVVCQALLLVAVAVLCLSVPCGNCNGVANAFTPFENYAGRLKLHANKVARPSKREVEESHQPSPPQLATGQLILDADLHLDDEQPQQQIAADKLNVSASPINLQVPPAQDEQEPPKNDSNPQDSAEKVSSSAPDSATPSTNDASEAPLPQSDEQLLLQDQNGNQVESPVEGEQAGGGNAASSAVAAQSASVANEDQVASSGASIGSGSGGGEQFVSSDNPNSSANQLQPAGNAEQTALPNLDQAPPSPTEEQVASSGEQTGPINNPETLPGQSQPAGGPEQAAVPNSDQVKSALTEGQGAPSTVRVDGGSAIVNQAEPVSNEEQVTSSDASKQSVPSDNPETSQPAGAPEQAALPVSDQPTPVATEEQVTSGGANAASDQAPPAQTQEQVASSDAKVGASEQPVPSDNPDTSLHQVQSTGGAEQVALPNSDQTAPVTTAEQGASRGVSTDGGIGEQSRTEENPAIPSNQLQPADPSNVVKQDDSAERKHVPESGQPIQQGVEQTTQVGSAAEKSDKSSQQEQPVAPQQIEQQTPITQPSSESGDSGKSATIQQETIASNDILEKQLNSTSQVQANILQTTVEQDKSQQQEDEIIAATSSLQEFTIDTSSCDSLIEALQVPPKILNMTIERILKSIRGEQCNKMLSLKLGPAVNRDVIGHVVEVSSASIELSQLFAGGQSSRIICLPAETATSNVANKSDGTTVKMQLRIEQDLDDQFVFSRWRTYPSLQHDELPIRLFAKTTPTRKTSNRLDGVRRTISRDTLLATKAGDKCLKFKTKSGMFRLDLLALKTDLLFQVELVKLSDNSYSASAEHNGTIRMIDYKVDELYLGHSLLVSNRNLRSITNSQSEANGWNQQQRTVQILHDHNNYQRRNNWLLDMYSNWLRHEYRSQLRFLLGKPLVEQLNMCLATRATSS